MVRFNDENVDYANSSRIDDSDVDDILKQNTSSKFKMMDISKNLTSKYLKSK